jgi:predicted ATPase
LGQELGKPPHPSILRALSTSYIIVANYEQSRKVGEQLLQLAEQVHDQNLLVEAHEALGITHFWTGAFAQARTHLEQSLALYDPEQLKSHMELFAWDPKVVGPCRLALTLWCLGYPDQALQVQQQSLTFAETLGHPFSSGYTTFWDALLQHMLGNVALVRAQTEAIIALSQKHYLVFWLRHASTFHGWAVAASGELERGMDEMLRGMTDFYALGIVNFMRPFYFTLLAELYAKLNQFDQSLELLANAAELIYGTNERWHEAELHRVRGDLLLAKGAEEKEAEVAYRNAIKVAQAQHARSFELRAATSLARLWQMQGKMVEARNLLQPAYDWFIEGFDTHDLKEAWALLEQLSTEPV